MTRPSAEAHQESVAPTLVVGLPVYNGERYLREALDSLLAQSFANFEIFISDNASTDETPTIAREYTERDSRIRYHRVDRNIGAGPNHNLTFTLTDSRYFKWAAHDDQLHPEFLMRCVSALEEDPSAVLAFSTARLVNEDGAFMDDYSPRLPTASPDPRTRFEAFLERSKCLQMYGVIRREVLGQTPLIGSYAASDSVLLARLALAGRFIEIPEPLFYSRKHAEQSSTQWAGNYWRAAEWHDPRFKGRATFPYWRILGEQLRAVMSAPVPLSDKVACLQSVARFWTTKRIPYLRGDLLHYVRAVTPTFGTSNGLARRAADADKPA